MDVGGPVLRSSAPALASGHPGASSVAAVARGRARAPRASGYSGTGNLVKPTRPNEAATNGTSSRRAPNQSARVEASQSRCSASNSQTLSGSAVTSQTAPVVPPFPCVMPLQRQLQRQVGSDRNASEGIGSQRSAVASPELAVPSASVSFSVRSVHHNSAAVIKATDSGMPSANGNCFQKKLKCRSDGAIVSRADGSQRTAASPSLGAVGATGLTVITPSPEPPMRLPSPRGLQGSLSPRCGSGSSPGPSISCERRIWAARSRSGSTGRSTPLGCRSRSSSSGSQHILYKNECRSDGPSGFIRIALGSAMLTESKAFSESEQTVLANCLQDYLNGNNAVPLARLEEVLTDCCRRLNYSLSASLLRTLANIGRRVAVADGLNAVSLGEVCSLLDEAKEYSMRQQRSFLAKALRQISPPQRGSVASCGVGCPGGFEALRSITPRQSYIINDND